MKHASFRSRGKGWIATLALASFPQKTHGSLSLSLWAKAISRGQSFWEGEGYCMLQSGFGSLLKARNCKHAPLCPSNQQRQPFSLLSQLYLSTMPDRTSRVFDCKLCSSNPIKRVACSSEYPTSFAVPTSSSYLFAKSEFEILRIARICQGRE